MFNVRWIAWCSALLVSGLAARAEADPIKLVPLAVTASNSYPGNPPSSAVDGDPNTFWSAGGAPTQWIQLDLGRTVSLRKIRLRVAQLPDGQTTHVISVGQDPSSLTTAYTFSGNTVSGQWLEYNLGGQELGNVRFIRVTTTQSPSWVAWCEIEVFGGVEYLGYYADAFNSDYIPQTTANGANLVWIAKYDGSNYAADFAAKLTEASLNNAKAVLVVTPQLFDGTVLFPDWEARWSAVATVVRAAPANVVAAFYPMDEPYGNFVSKETMAAVAARIRQDFPTTPIATTFGTWEMLNLPLGPDDVQMFDWVGVDCYYPGGTGWDNCDGAGTHMPDLISKLRSWLSPTQRMTAVPRAFLWHDELFTSDLPANQVSVLNDLARWQAEIQSDGRYVAVVPFLWQSAAIPSNRGLLDETGAGDLPWVKERLYQYALTLFAPGDNRVFVADWTTSSTDPNGGYADYLPFAAFNRDTSNANGWNAGGFPTQWIEARFGGSTRIGRIQLWVNQLPAGQTTHVIQGRLANGSWLTLGTLQGYTQDGQVLTWVPPIYGLHYDVDRIRINTTQSPSWVAWHDIQFFTN